MDIVKVGISVFCVCIIGLGLLGVVINMFLMGKQNIYTAQAFFYLLFFIGLVGTGLGGFYILNNAYFPLLIFLLSIVITIAGLLGAAFIKQPNKEVGKDGTVWIKRPGGQPGYEEIIENENTSRRYKPWK